MIDIHDGASVRNLERIQESSTASAGGRAIGWGVVVLSGACVLFAALAFSTRKTATAPAKKSDPLGELAPAKPIAPNVLPGEVTFPGMLSDHAHPAAPLAATAATSVVEIPAPPPPTDKLPVVPLPAKHTLTGLVTSKTPAPSNDKLTTLAEASIDPTSTTALAAPGNEGGWQVQVSSFRTQAEADGFVLQLRARGHKAHVQRADVPNRGTWYRVKIGPFATQLEANRYRSSFEAKEKMPAFVVKSGTDPH